MITAVVTDAAGQIETATINLSINEPEQPLLVSTFEWVRHGADAVTGGIENVGLKWTKNLKDVNAVIEPLDGVVFYAFNNPGIWDEVETEADKVAAFSLENIENYDYITDFRGVSAFATKDYDYVLGTYYNGK